MDTEELKVLAVADPAVIAYTDKKKALLKKFGEKVKIDVFAWDRYYQTMMDVFAGKTYYDIVMAAGHLWKRDFIEKGYLAPITFDTEDFLPVIVKEMEYQGKYYLSPSFCDGHMIVYRKSILKEVLGDTLKEVITPKEYLEAAEKLSKAGYKIAMKADISEIFTDALPFLRQNGLDIYGEKNQKVQCDRDEIIDGLEDYCRLRKSALEDTNTYGNEQTADRLKTKKAAMGVTWSGQLGVVCDGRCVEAEDLGFATFTTAWNVTWSFAMSAGCQKKEKANALLAFLRSKEMDIEAGSVSGAPVRRGSYLLGADQFPWYSCQLKMIENAVLLPDLSCANDKNKILYDWIYQAFTGKVTPREAMKEAKKQIGKLEV